MTKKLAHIVSALLRGKRGMRGESLTEVLVAMTIGGLALLMLIMAIAVATNMTMDSRDNMNRYYEQNNAAIGSTATSIGSGTVSLKDSGDETVPLADASGEMSVKYYKNDKAGSSDVILYNDASTSGGA